MKSIGLTLMAFFTAIVSLGQGITDIDNNFYDTIRIGRQIWFAKNLTVTRLNDGTPIANVTDQSAWAASRNPAYCWYNNDHANGAIYGALYNGYVVKTGKLCPAGWRVPSDAEWSELVSAMGGPFVAAGKLKATGTAYWQSPNVGATNEVGFSALPGGLRSSDNFYVVGIFGNWWSSTEYEPDYAWTQSMKHDEPGMNAPPGVSFGIGLSVRCMKEVTAPCRTSDGIQTVRSCGPYTWIDGITYSLNTNAPTLRLTSKAGCDSLVRLHLTILTNTISTQSVSACDSYTWIDGKTYTASNNTATFKLTNKAGCDSLVYLNLTIGKSTSSTHNVAACGAYTWIDGKTYTASNNSATFKLTNKAGCDSLVHLNLSVNSAMVTLMVDGPTITSDLVGESYAWFDCGKGEFISNANGRSFEPVASGSYAVHVMNNGCLKASDCLIMVVTGMQQSFENEFVVSPNPSTDFIQVSSTNQENGPVTITVIDAKGSEVFVLNSSAQQSQIDISALLPGLYFAKIRSNSAVHFVRFSKAQR